MKDVALCTNLVAHFEGFASHAYWDVNAFRIGFGSDTRTAAQIPVRRGDYTTYADAKANLAARLPQFEAVIVSEIGADRWDGFPPNAQAALIDFVYNYGSLTPTLRAHCQSGDLASIAQALADRAVDNARINATRRLCEAAFVASVE